MDTRHDLVVGSMRLSTVAIVDIEEHGVTTLNDGGVGSHQSLPNSNFISSSYPPSQSTVQYRFGCHYTFHAKLPEFGDGASKKDELGKYFDL